jgi:CBS domain-containing protein
MAEHGLGSVLVTDSGKVIGLFTEHDLLTRVVGAGKQPQTVNLGETCSRNLISIPHDSSCKAAIHLMRHNNCRRLLVYHHDNLRGLISISTVAHAMTENQGLKNMLVNLVGGLTLAVVLLVIVMLITVLPDMLQVAENAMR